MWCLYLTSVSALVFNHYGHWTVGMITVRSSNWTQSSGLTNRRSNLPRRERRVWGVWRAGGLWSGRDHGAFPLSRSRSRGWSRNRSRSRSRGWSRSRSRGWSQNRSRSRSWGFEARRWRFGGRGRGSSCRFGWNRVWIWRRWRGRRGFGGQIWSWRWRTGVRHF